jgi:hypothetical protein
MLLLIIVHLSFLHSLSIFFFHSASHSLSPVLSLSHSFSLSLSSSLSLFPSPSLRCFLSSRSSAACVKVITPLCSWNGCSSLMQHGRGKRLDENLREKKTRTGFRSVSRLRLYYCTKPRTQVLIV